MDHKQTNNLEQGDAIIARMKQLGFKLRDDIWSFVDTDFKPAKGFSYSEDYIYKHPRDVERALNTHFGLTWGIAKELVGCAHEWKHYMGLEEQFNYCEKCDERREL